MCRSASSSARPATWPRSPTTSRPSGDPARSGRRSRRCTAASATEVHASDLTLDKFIDAETLAAAPSLPGPSAEVRTVLLTGATGFLGRYLALEWLQRMDLVDGKVICLVRAKDDDAARERLDAVFDSGDPELLRALPRTGRRPPRGASPATRARPISGWIRRHVAAAGRHRRPDRRPGGAGQPRAALQPAVRPQRARHRRADPHRAHHQGSSRSPTCRRSASAWASNRASSPRTPTSGSSAPPARSTTATPTATRTASGPAKCCCARRTTSAACRCRCSAAT